MSHRTSSESPLAVQRSIRALLEGDGDPPPASGSDAAWAAVETELGKILGQFRGDGDVRAAVKAIEKVLKAHGAFEAAIGRGDKGDDGEDPAEVQEALRERRERKMRDLCESMGLPNPKPIIVTALAGRTMTDAQRRELIRGEKRARKARQTDATPAARDAAESMRTLRQ